jgi:hypothetical protein
MFYFCGSFLPSWIRSGFWIRIRIHWPDWIRIQSGSGYGSGSGSGTGKSNPDLDMHQNNADPTDLMAEYGTRLANYRIALACCRIIQICSPSGSGSVCFGPSWIRIQIRLSKVRIRGSGSGFGPKWHGSASLFFRDRPRLVSVRAVVEYKSYLSKQ